MMHETGIAPAAPRAARPGGAGVIMAAWRWWLSELGAGLSAPVFGSKRFVSWPDGPRPRKGLLNLLLEPGIALEKTLTLPARAEAKLQDVVRHEIRRQFPFPAELCVFGAECVGRDETHGQIRVRVAALPLSDLDEIESDLQAEGVGWSAIAVPSKSGKEPLILARGQSGASWSKFDTGLAVFALLALAASLALPYWLELSALERYRALASAPQMHEQMEAKARRTLLLRAEALYPDYSVTGLIEALAAALPDSAWVQRLRFNDGAIEIEGTAENAASLVPLLEALPGIEGVSFSAPTVSDPALGIERYRLRLLLDTGRP